MSLGCDRFSVAHLLICSCSLSAAGRFQSPGCSIGRDLLPPWTWRFQHHLLLLLRLQWPMTAWNDQPPLRRHRRRRLKQTTLLLLLRQRLPTMVRSQIRRRLDERGFAHMQKDSMLVSKQCRCAC